MNKSKQATLFQSWGKRKKESETRADNPALASISHSICPESYSTIDPEIIDLCKAVEEDEDDEFLLEALDNACTGQNGSSSYSNIVPAKCSTVGNKQQDNNGNISQISIGADLLPTQLGYTQDNSLPGFDRAAGKLWIYPTNYPVREYQFNIVQQALFKNTLVVLPTGLGKTFIASVLMYNLYRWYPQGKVIFMAPTKPLVAQQIEACYKIMGIPQKDTAEMTGNMGPTKREKAWCENRVFFLTPQVMANDLSRGSCPAEKVKCLVVDEAHKALGNHAYCQVVRELVKYTQDFRVLALSATPGSDIKTVQQVINNLLISQIELRTEDSPDICKFSHERKVEKIVIPLGDELSSVKATYIKILEVFVSRLKRQGVLYNRDTTSLSKFLILKAREAFRQNPPERLPRQHYGAVEGDFALALSLYHGYELLQLHGARSLYTFLDGIVNGEKGYGRTRAELMRNSDFNDLLEMLAQKFTPEPSQRSSISSSASKEKKPFVTGHPKMEKLQEIVLDHFQNFAKDENIKKGLATRIMIFSQYRDSVKEITDMLNQHYPLVKVMSFIGQSSAGKSTKGFTQKEQLKVMKQFREGGYNTLVSTCVGEEGLDIGEVDLIICFDAHKSPIRLVQRMGRTGRKREGRIVMLVTQGKEEQIYNQSQYSKRSIHKAILNGAKSLHFYQFSPRIVPDNTAPTCHKMHISIKEQFKPTRKLSADKDQCTNSVIGMKSLASSEEILTREEYEELVSEWGLPLDQVPKMPKSSDIICMSTELQEDMDEKENDSCRVLSLTEWLPWQNQLQPTHMIEHSLASKHLVELMEFIEIQQTLNPEDDNYGLEMATYLDEDDILKPMQTKSYTDGIKQFCVPLSETTEIDTRQFRRKRRNSAYITDLNEDCEVNSEQVCNRKTKKRKTDLPDIEIQQVEILPDEVELPPFDLNAKNPVDKGMSKRHNGVLSENQMFEDSEERQYNLKPSGKFLSSDAIVNQRKCTPQDVNADNEKALPLVMQKLYDRRKTESDLLRKNRKGVKKKHTKVRQSVVEVIADMDDHDFDISEKNEFQNSDQLIPISSPGKECERIVFSNIDELSNINFDVEDENIIKMFKLLPVIRGVGHSNNHKVHGEKDMDKAGSMYSVRSPPSVVDMVETLNASDIEHGMICLDITQIAEEWEKENQINNTGEINSVLDLEKCEYNFGKLKKGVTELPSVCQKQLGSSQNIHTQLFKNKSENSLVSKISKSLVNDLTTYVGMKEELKKLSENFEQGPTNVLRNGISDSKSFTVHSEESISLQDDIIINKSDKEGTVFMPSGNPGMKQVGGSPRNIKQGNFDICKVGAKTSLNSKQQLLSIGRDDVRHQKASVLNSHAPTDNCSVLNADKMDKIVMDISESHRDSDDSDIDELLFLCLEKSRKRVSSSCAKNYTSLGKKSQVVSSLNHGHDYHEDSTDKLSDVTDIFPLNHGHDYHKESIDKLSDVTDIFPLNHGHDCHKESTDKLSDVTDIYPLNQKAESCIEREIISGSLKSLKSRICSKFEKSVCDFPDGDSRSRQNQTLNIAQGDTSSFVLDKDLHMHRYSPSSDSRSKLNSRMNTKYINSQQTCSEDSNTKMQTKLLLANCDAQVIEHDKVYSEKDRSRIDSLQFERNNSFNEIFGDDSDFDGQEAVETSWAKKDTSAQFTFTQALDCINDSLVLSTEPVDTYSRDRHGKGMAASKQKTVDANFNDPDRSDSRVVNSMAAQFMHTLDKDKEILPSKESQTAKENTKYHKQRHDVDMVKNTVNTATSGLSNSDDEDQIEFPKFDLGFDLDEDIIPPSPCSTQFSQSSLSNQKSFHSRRSLKLSSKEESFSENSCIVASDCQVQIVQHEKSNLNSTGDYKNDDVFVAIKRKNNNNQTGKGNLETIVEVFDVEKEQNMKNTGNEDKLRRKSFNYIENSKSLDVEERHNRNDFGSDEKLQRMDRDMQDEQKMISFNSEDLTRHDTGSVAEGNDAICSCIGLNKTYTSLTNKFDKMGKGLLLGHELVSNKQTIIESNMQIKAKTNKQTIIESNMQTKAKHNMQTKAKSFSIEDESNDDCSFQQEDVVFETSFSLQYEDDLLKELVETEDQDIATSVVQDKPTTQSSQSTKIRNLVCAADSHASHFVENTNGEEPDKGVENDPYMQNMSVENDSDMDDSFVVVGKKRKMAILSSPESPDYSSKIRKMDSGNLDCQFKTPLRPTLSLLRGKSSIINTDSKDTKSSKACLSFDLANVQNEDEDEDFENSSLWFSRQAQNKVVEEPKRLIKGSVKIKSDIEKEVNSCILTKDKMKKRKCSFRSNPFIEHEAEVNEEDMWQVSEDEADHSDLDNLDESFINDATQMSQAQAVDDSDMHAVYLKSIRSPIHHRESGHFKLQNHYHRRNVFAQVPEEDESQYMEDSFCVADEDVEELSLISEDDEEAEIKILKEISPPRRRQTGKSKMENFKAKLKPRNKSNRRLIRTIADSSSDEELDHKKEDINSSNKEFSRKFEIKKALSLPSIDDEEDVCDNAKLNSSTKKCISKSNTSVHDGCKESVCVKNTNPPVKDIHCKTTEELRQERLKRQKEKQEEFKRMTAEKAGLQNIKVGCDMKDKEHGKLEEEMTKLKHKSTCTSVKNVTKLHENELDIIYPELSEEESSMDIMTDINTSTGKPTKKLVLLVDSREISGAQDIVSTLRFQHSIHVCAAQLPGCDYIVSNRMAVDRKQWSEFSNGSNRVKLIERMQYFAELYDQPCLILESDRIKLGDDKSHRPIHWTKYVDKMLSQLIRSNIRLYFTNNQIETAALLAELCQLEHRKNMAISVPLELNSQQQSVAKFLCTVPMLGYIHVLNLCNGFRTLSDLLDSSIMSIEKKGHISQSRAMEVYRYIRRIFDSNMLPGN